MELVSRNYYAIKDLISSIYSASDLINLKLGIVVDDALKTIVNSIFWITTSNNEPYQQDESNILWCKYIIPNYYDHYITYIDDDDFDEAYYQDWLRLFVAKLNETYTRYKKLIDIYASEESKLLEDVKSYTRFNDTPQNGGTFTSDSYTSTYTENGSNIATKMARLEEIRTYYDNIYKQWLDEFGGLFINE